jgi:hypothetical protein
MPFARASAAMSFAGKSCPVVQVTWLMKMSRVRALIVAGPALDVGVEDPNDDAVSLRPIEEGGVQRSVFMARGDDLVSSLETQAIHDQADALGGGRDQGEVLLSALLAQEASQPHFDEVPRFGIVAGTRCTLFGPDALRQRVEHRQRTGTEAMFR